MRNGPGEQFDVIEKIAGGQQALVTGVSRDSHWWRVICPDSTVGNCWVSADPTLTQPIAPAGATGVQPEARARPPSTRHRYWPKWSAASTPWTTPSAATRSCP